METVRVPVIDELEIERVRQMMVQRFGLAAGHGRTLFHGQIWRSNDPRRLRGVRIVGFNFADTGFAAYVVNIVSGVGSLVPLRRFAPGRDGFSLERNS